MGFTSIDDWISKVSGSGNFLRVDWAKTFQGVAPYTLMNSQALTDLGGYDGFPIGHRLLGDYVVNGYFNGSTEGWTTTTGWARTGNGAMAHNADGTGTLTQTGCVPVAGRSYRVSYTISSYTSGTCTVAFGGTSGSARSSAATFTETIVASDTTCLTFTPSSTSRFTISVVYVHELKGATPLSDQTWGAMYHGGNVDPSTKHIVNVGIFDAANYRYPRTFMLVDKLLVYQGIDRNNISTTQTLVNNQTLPRYTSGLGVRALLIASQPDGSGSNMTTATISYKNQDGDIRFVTHTVGAAGSNVNGICNFSNSFFPLCPGDTGITTLESIRLTDGQQNAGSLMELLLVRPLLNVHSAYLYQAAEKDFLYQCPSLPRVYDGAFLDYIMWNGAIGTVTGGSISGYIDFCWG